MKHKIEIGDKVYDDHGIDYIVIDITTIYVGFEESPLSYVVLCEHRDPDQTKSFIRSMVIPYWAFGDEVLHPSDQYKKEEL